MPNSKKNSNEKSGFVPPQRKTTLKWGSDGELSSIDMTRVLARLSNPELTKCDLSTEINDSK